VGSTIDWNPRRRDHRRLLKKNIHGNKYLQAAWNKYGEDQFEFIVIEKFEECSEVDLRIKEQEWVEKLQSHKEGFNCAYPVKQHAPSERMTEAHEAYWNGLDKNEKAERVAYLKTEDHQQKATKGKQTEEHRLDKSIKAKKQWSDPAYDEKRIELRDRINSLKKDPEFWKNRAEKIRVKWQDPEYRAKHIAQILEANKKAAEAKKIQWADPEYRAKNIARMIEMGKRPKPRKNKEGKLK